MEFLSFQKLLLMMMLSMMLGNMATCELHYVGGSKSSWAPNVNFTKWSSQEHFYLDDWLYFGYEKHMYNVLEVNKISYENCRDTEFIKNITRGGGRDVVQLTEAKTYYFLSGGGFCWQGMKVAINVSENVALAPAPSKSSSATNVGGIQVNQVLMVLIFVLMLSIYSNNI